jgi:hypothetical protein
MNATTSRLGNQYKEVRDDHSQLLGSVRECARAGVAMTFVIIADAIETSIRFDFIFIAR